MFFRRDHWGHLIKIAPKFFERCADFGLVQLRHRFCLDDFTFSILRARSRAKRKGANIFLIFAHQQILNFCSASDREEKQAGRDWIERSAMADFFYSQLPPSERD